MQEREYQNKIKKLERIYSGQEVEVQWYPFREKDHVNTAPLLTLLSDLSLRRQDMKPDTQSFLKTRAFCGTPD